MLTVKLGLFSFAQLKRGEILPIMLYCAGFLSLLNGQFGQPTNLGFAVLSAVSVWRRPTRKTPIRNLRCPEGAALRRVARRSRYAERIHTSPAARRLPDDFADR